MSVQPAPHPARRLTAAQLRDEVVTVEHGVRAEYAWDAGVAIGRYLAGLREGRILGRRCRRCRRVLVPPRMFCEQCFRPTDEWVDAGQTGVVATFSVCHVSWDMQPLSKPELPAVIHLDGASRGMGILHKLGNVHPEGVTIGMRVRAVWKPSEERTGSILDIRFWEPVPSDDTNPVETDGEAAKGTSQGSDSMPQAGGGSAGATQSTTGPDEAARGTPPAEDG